jgi:methionyl-tRNA formyltransferase
MRIIILTQDDPFYLSSNIDFLLKNLPAYAQVVGTVVFDVSPFGKRETFTQKMKKTYDVFGLQFFTYYGLKFIKSKLFSPTIAQVLKTHNVPLLKIDGSINSKTNLAILRTYSPDLLVSIGGNQIFKLPLIQMASFWVLKNNEAKTGISVFFVDEGIDSGPIVVQKTIEIGNKSQEELIKHTKQIGMESILEAIEKIQTNDVNLIANKAEHSSYFSFPTRADVKEFYKLGKRFF